jgi:hypothetical protein
LTALNLQLFLLWKLCQSRIILQVQPPMAGMTGVWSSDDATVKHNKNKAKSNGRRQAKPARRIP